jgi:hypothetical protein
MAFRWLLSVRRVMSWRRLCWGRGRRRRCFYRFLRGWARASRSGRSWLWWRRPREPRIGGGDGNSITGRGTLRSTPAGAGSTRVSAAQKSTQRLTKYGITIGLAALAGLLFPTIAMLLIIVAGLLIASGRESKKVDELLSSFPGGGHVSKALAQLDSWLACKSLRDYSNRRFAASFFNFTVKGTFAHGRLNFIANDIGRST